MPSPLERLIVWKKWGRALEKSRHKHRLHLERLEERTVPTVMSTQLFFDQFDNNDINYFSSNWSVVQGATHDVSTRLNPPPVSPSNGYAIKLDVDSSGGNLLTSRALDLSAETNLTFSYWFERKGAGVATAAGDDLLVEAKTASG